MSMSEIACAIVRVRHTTLFRGLCDLVDAGVVVLRREFGLAVDKKQQIHVLVVAGLSCGLRLTYLPARTFTVASALDARSSFYSVRPGIV